MSILDNLDKLEVVTEKSSFIKCVCPVCSQPSLKISLSSHAYGAYRCYDNECSTEDIRSAIGLVKTKNYYLSPYKPDLKLSVYDSKKLVQDIEKAKPLELEQDWKNYDVIKVPENYQPLESRTKSFFDGSKKKITIYPYSDVTRVYRLDYENSGNKKEVYLQYMDLKTGNWELGLGDYLWPVYSRGLEFDGDTLLVVEGEKTAEYVKSELGVAAVTLATPYFQMEKMKKALYVFFRKNPTIQNLIYVPDHDDPGWLKAHKFQKVCWYLKKNCSIVSLKDYLNLSFEPSKGQDIADFALATTSK